MPVEHPIVQGAAQQQERQRPNHQQQQGGQHLPQRQSGGITEQQQRKALGRKCTSRLYHTQQHEAGAVGQGDGQCLTGTNRVAAPAQKEDEAKDQR